MSERNGIGQLFLYDFTTSSETQLTSAALGDSAPVISPDGKTLAFVRDGKELRALDLASKQERVLAKGYLSRSNRGLAWSPDNRWVAYIGVTNPSFRNIFAVPAEGGESRAVTAMPNGNANNVSWSPDGTYIIFNTNQRTEPGEAVRVDLILKTPRFREDRFRDLFRRSRRVAQRRAQTTRDDSAASGRDSGGHRLRRHPSTAEHSARRRRRQRAEHQPRRPLAAADRDRGGAAEPLCLLARRTVARAGRGASAHVDGRRQGRRAVHARQPRGVLPRAGPHHHHADRNADGANRLR